MALSLLRLVAGLVLLVLARTLPLQALASAFLFFASFTVAHDLAHGAYRLPRHLNTFALSVAALPMLVSGHAMRIMHLRHHARPLAPDDVEGEGARHGFFRALLLGPRNMLTLRVAAFAAADARGRRRQTIEMAAVLGVVVLAATLPGAAWLRTHVVVALVLLATTSLWASHIPHHAPPWLASACARLAFLRSPVLLSLAFHERHHRHPRIPCADLAQGSV